MFDLRYHAVSLAAVFIAIVLGILVGIGISGRGFVDDSERDRLNLIIDEARAERDAARDERDSLELGSESRAEFLKKAYPIVMSGRLAGKRIAVVVIGPVNTALDASIRKALTDANGVLLRRVVLRLPTDMSEVRRTLETLAESGIDADRWGTNGTSLGLDLVKGDGVLLTAFRSILVEERSGSADEEADGVIVVAPPPPELGTPRGEFVRGIYTGLADGGNVAVESSDVLPGQVAELARFGFATVDNADTPIGRVAIVAALLGGVESEGSRYGVKESAEQGPLPSLDPLLPGG